MTTVEAIAKAAFDAVAADITDAILDVTVTRITQGAYNVSTGVYAETTTTQTGRAVLDTVKPVADLFPAHVRGPKDQLFIIEGITALREGDEITIGATDYAVAAVQDIVGAGSLFYAIAQVKP